MYLPPQSSILHLNCGREQDRRIERSKAPTSPSFLLQHQQSTRPQALAPQRRPPRRGLPSLRNSSRVIAQLRDLLEGVGINHLLLFRLFFAAKDAFSRPCSSSSTMNRRVPLMCCHGAAFRDVMRVQHAKIGPTTSLALPRMVAGQGTRFPSGPLDVRRFLLFVRWGSGQG